MIARAVLLALAWVALTGDATWGGAGFALVLAVAVLFVARPLPGEGFASVRLRPLLSLVLYFAGQVLLANYRVARAALGPVGRLRPSIVAVPLEDDGDAEVALLANLVTLTPGTLSLEISEDRRTLYVHALEAPDADALRAEVKDGFERRIREALR